MTRWLLVLSMATGCSFTLSGPDPKAPPTQAPSCDTNKNLVIVDGVLATAAGITALSVAANDGAAAIVPALIGALFVGSAIHGNSVVDRCRRANSFYLDAMAAQKRAPVVAEDSEDPPRPALRRPVPPRPVAAEPAVQTVQAPAASPPAPVQSPAPVQPPAPQLPQPQPAPEGPASEWADFWKEVR